MKQTSLRDRGFDMIDILNIENIEALPKPEGILNTNLKDAIVLNDEVWIIKPALEGGNISSPINEFIGSHVYEILKYDVQKTFLAIRNNNLVVICKDFAVNKRLVEIGSIKASIMEADKEFRDFIESKLDKNVSELDMDIQSTILHIEHNPILNIVSGVRERFWEQSLIDLFINNIDRHIWNWGLLLIPNENLTLAPIYDNDKSFYSDLSESDIARLLSNEEELNKRVIDDRLMYCLNKYISEYIADEGFINAVKKVIPLIEEKMESIVKFIEAIPETTMHTDGLELEVCSESRKELYIKSMKIRFDTILKPLYNNMM